MMLYFKNIPIGAYFLNKEKRLLLKTSGRYARQGNMPAYRYNGLDFAIIVSGVIEDPYMVENYRG